MRDVLDALMTEVLAQMSVISEQKARNYDSANVRSGEQDRIPRLSDKPMADYWRDRYNSAKGDPVRREVALGAVAALKNARKAVPPREEPRPDHPLWKAWVASSTLSNGEVAYKFGVSRQYVHRIRQQYVGG